MSEEDRQKEFAATIESLTDGLIDWLRIVKASAAEDRNKSDERYLQACLKAIGKATESFFPVIAIIKERSTKH